MSFKFSMMAIDSHQATSNHFASMMMMLMLMASIGQIFKRKISYFDRTAHAIIQIQKRITNTMHFLFQHFRFDFTFHSKI